MPDAPANPSPRSPLPGTRAWALGRWRQERGRADELLKRAQWLQAELENVRKQAERDAAQAGERAVAALLRRLLPVMDSLQHAAAQAAKPEQEGLALVHAELEKALAAEGLSPIRCAGERFDPDLHEAVQRAERPCREGEEPGLVVEQELRRGYLFRGRVLRPALVLVVERVPRQPADADGAPPAEERPRTNESPSSDPGA